MSKKSFKIARKPGQALESAIPAGVKDGKTQHAKNAQITAQGVVSSPTTRKTIEVPEDYFFRVKMRALERKMLEKELWSEILREYFKAYPSS